MKGMDKKDFELKNFEFFDCLAGERTCAIFPLELKNQVIADKNQLTETKLKLKKKGFGFSEFLSKRIDEGKLIDNHFLFIYDISENQIISLLKDLNLPSIIFKDKASCRQMCLNASNKSLDVIKVIELRKIDTDFLKEIFLASLELANNLSFELFLVEPPRPSYFQVKERYVKII